MKNFFIVIMLLSSIAFVSSCKKDEGKLPNIAFKTGATYISSDTTVAAGSIILVGINASKAESADVLKKFNISSSLNGAAATTVYDVALSGTDGDAYTYDYTATMDTIAGKTNKLSFTVTNRDGLVNTVSLTVTTQ